MKKVFITLTAMALLFTFNSCGGGEETEESTHETEESTEETSEETVEEETEESTGIAEDLDNETFKSYLDEKSGVLIDVRTADEFSEGAIEGAVNHDWMNGDFEKAVASMDKNAPTFVYCAAGGRSGQAKDYLVENGFVEVYNLAGGYGGWTE